jgi:WbqC-like protein
MVTIAVMQPYFLPYAGYFRLFAAADQVALFDCVQFPRRGWVHRNRLPNGSGNPAWLTLPLRGSAMETRIADLRFAQDAAPTMQQRCNRFPQLREVDHPLLSKVLDPTPDVVGYLETLLRQCCGHLDLPFETTRTSSLDIDPALRGQDRVLAIVEALGGDRYINLEGGQSLYDPEAFADREIELSFLPTWQGSTWSILQRLLSESPASVADEIRGQL